MDSVPLIAAFPLKEKLLPESLGDDPRASQNKDRYGSKIGASRNVNDLRGSPLIALVSGPNRHECFLLLTRQFLGLRCER